MLSALNAQHDAARALAASGRYGDAIKVCRRLLAADPQDVRALLRLGDLHLRRVEHDRALSAYERVAEQYYRDGNRIKAVAVYKHIHYIIATGAPHLERRFGHTYARLATIYAAMGLEDDALAACEHAAELLRTGGREQDAAELFSELVVSAPSSARARARLGEAQARLGRIDEAVQELGCAAGLLIDSGRRDEALQILEQLLAFRRDPCQAALAARLYLARGRPNDAVLAVAKLQICFNQDPEHLPTLLVLAHAFDCIAAPDKAGEVRKQAAWIAWRRGRLDVLDDLLAQLCVSRRSDSGVAELLSLRAYGCNADDTVPDAVPPVAIGEESPERDPLGVLPDTTPGDHAIAGGCLDGSIERMAREAWTSTVVDPLPAGHEAR